MPKIIMVLSMSMSVFISAFAQNDGRIMLSAYESITRMQDVMMEERMPEDRSNLPVQELFAQRPAAINDGRQMLTAYESIQRMQGVMLNEPAPNAQYAMPQPQWYDYPPVRQYAAPGLYQPPMYAAAYAPVYYAAPNPQQNQAFVNWLFGTPRREDAPADVAEPAPEPVHVAAAIAPQPTPKLVRAVEPTPQPTIAAAAESAVPPTVSEASVMTAPTVHPPAAAATTAAPAALTEPLPEPTLLTSAEYWTRKIILTGLLLIIMGFALYKERAATRHTEQRASRQIDDLEQELRRLDRLIYGDEQPGGRTP